MFICGKCKKVSNPGEKSFRVIIEDKIVEHPHRPRAYPPPMREGSWRPDRGGTGKQIVQEITVGACCLDTINVVEGFRNVLPLRSGEGLAALEAVRAELAKLR
jgi:hypothetical protein